MKIETPCILDLDDETYHGDPCVLPSLSAGCAKVLLTATPMHAADAHPRLRVPGLPPKEPDADPKFDIGKAAHAIMTGKGADVAIVDAKDWRSGAAKAAREAARAAGKTALLADQAEGVLLMIRLIRDQLIADPAIGYDPFGRPEHNEMSMFWTDGRVWCRAKPDAIDYDHRIIWDLKTSGTLADPDAWTLTQISATGIDLRAAHYLHGARSLLGPGWRYVFVVAEAARPHAISVVELPGLALEMGEDKRQHAVRRFGQCLEMGLWPGWPAGFNRPELPEYVETKWVARRDRDRAASPSPAAMRAARDMQAPN